MPDSPTPNGLTTPDGHAAAQAFDAAVARGLHCTLAFPSAGATRSVRSRLLGRDDETGGVWVALDDAVDRGALAALIRSGEAIALTTGAGAAQQADLLLRVPALRCDERYPLNDHTTVPALLLARPKELLATRRRQHFRVPIAAGGADDASARIWKIPEQGLYRDRAPASQELRAELLELSTGGMKVKVFARGTEALRLVARQRLRVELRLGAGELILEGRVRHPVATARDDESAVLGVSFESLDRDLESRRAQGVLAKFLAELQRTAMQRQWRKSA